MADCRATQQSDEMYCAPCNLRWDVNDSDPPPCRNSFPSVAPAPDNRTPDRKKLDAVAKGYNDLMALQQKQRDTTAKMIRACVARLKSPDSRKRKEAIDALDQLATMMENGR